MSRLRWLVHTVAVRRLRQLSSADSNRVSLPRGRNGLIGILCGHTALWPAYLVVTGVIWLAGGPLLAVAVVAHVWLIRRAARTALRRSMAATAGTLSGAALAGMADDLRAGRGTDSAFLVALHQVEAVAGKTLCPVCARNAKREWRRVVLAVPNGPQATAVALRKVSAPFDTWAQRLAAAWFLTDSGVAMGGVLDGLDREIEAVRELERIRAVHTAAARATATVLGGLPLVGLLLGSALGANPVSILLGTPLGGGCLLGATILQLAGWAWAERIVAERRGAPWVQSARLRRWPNLRIGALSVGRRKLSRSRLHSTVHASGPPISSDKRRLSMERPRVRALRRWIVGGFVGAVAAWFAGGIFAIPLAVLLMVLVSRGLSGVEAKQSAKQDPLWEAQFPYALSLIAGLLRSGATTPRAVSAVARALPGPVGNVLRPTGAALQRGLPFRPLWPAQYAAHAAVESLFRSLERTGESGAALAGCCERLAAQLRKEATAAAVMRAQRSGVVMVGPLMCCFLPAFVLLGVVPVVASVLSQALNSAQ